MPHPCTGCTYLSSAVHTDEILKMERIICCKCSLVWNASTQCWRSLKWGDNEYCAVKQAAPFWNDCWEITIWRETPFQTVRDIFITSLFHCTHKKRPWQSSVTWRAAVTAVFKRRNTRLIMSDGVGTCGYPKLAGATWKTDCFYVWG